MTEKERMLAGGLYRDDDAQLAREYKNAKRLTRLFNATTEEEGERRARLLGELFGAMGRGVHIEPPFQCDFGCNIYIGDFLYANYGCIVLDPGLVHIGSHVFLGPRVCIYTAGHPIDAAVRNERLEYGHAVHIGDDVWLGGNSVVNPGVAIGSNVVVGAGSIVTRDIPSGVVAAGNPCRVLRPITREDVLYWQRQREAYYEAK